MWFFFMANSTLGPGTGPVRSPTECWQRDINYGNRERQVYLPLIYLRLLVVEEGGSEPNGFIRAIARASEASQQRCVSVAVSRGNRNLAVLEGSWPSRKIWERRLESGGASRSALEWDTERKVTLHRMLQILKKTNSCCN